jgi:hypothetical protein
MEKLDRRSFLGWAATGAAGLLLPELTRPKRGRVVFDMGRHCEKPLGEWFEILDEIADRTFTFVDRIWLPAGQVPPSTLGTMWIGEDNCGKVFPSGKFCS